MPHPVRDRDARALIAGLAVAVMATLCLSVLVSPAEAALPTKRTTYKDAELANTGPSSGSIKIKVGSSKRKIKKMTITAMCGSSPDKLVFKNVPITDNGSFSIITGDKSVDIEGKFKTKHKAKGSIRTDQCGRFGGDFVAKD